MRQLLLTLVTVVSFASCTGPTLGGACSTSDDVSCKSGSEVYACVGGKWAAVPCSGPQGCTDSTAFNCDLSVAVAGTSCPPWASGRVACQFAPAAIVSCVGGTWVQSAPCPNSCSLSTGAPVCVSGNTGGGGGSTTGGGGGTNTGGGAATGGGGGTNTGGGGGTSTGGGGGTTTGGGGGTACSSANCSGCCSNGQCLQAPLNSTTNFCGRNGAVCDDCGARGQRCDASNFVCVNSTSCNPTTCPNGCCANGQCFAPPINSSANFCGTGGAACRDCGRIGLVCSASTFSCVVSGTGGGGGSTGGGGGTTGGGGGSTTGGGGGTTGGGGGTTGGGGGSDPCQGVPLGGQCVSSTLVQYCSIPTGSGAPSVQTYQCPGGTTCQPNGAGVSCIRSGSCIENDARCATATTIQVCNASGSWGASQSCSGGCIGSPVGAQCGISPATTVLTGTLQYQTKNPRADMTDWDVVTNAPARNVLVISQRGQSWIDAQVTDGSGHFSIKVPTSAGPNDSVVFAAYGGDGVGLRYSLADPGLGTGTFSPGQQGSNARYWSWSKPVTSLTNGATTTITAAQGSGALNIYDLLQAIWSSSVTNNQGRQGLSITIFMGIGTEWSCGACFSESSDSESGIWMPGASADEGYWSDYTIAHELGHWQMRSYGTSPNEGGTHYIGCPTFPGQAWSEGYATWHSAAVRNKTLLEDKQQGGFFWFDVASRTYYPGSSQPAPINGPGGTNLLAQIDENAVSTMLWTVSASRPSGAREIFNAISSAHMNTSPWPRGYARRTWDVGNNCTKTNVVNTGEASLHLADIFDALSCGGSPAQSNRVPAATITAACSTPPSTTNATYYPFPTSSPICRSGFCYGCKTGSTCNAGNVASACGTGGVACVQCSTGQTCTNGVCL